MKVEVIDKMAAVGVAVLNSYISDAPRVYDDEHIVMSIFEAMLRAALSENVYGRYRIGEINTPNGIQYLEIVRPALYGGLINHE